MKKENYIKAVKALNEAAMCFALLGYMVESTYYSNHVSMALTIFFTTQRTSRICNENSADIKTRTIQSNYLHITQAATPNSTH